MQIISVSDYRHEMMVQSIVILRCSKKIKSIMNTSIKILGPGCAKCKSTFEVVKKAVNKVAFSSRCLYYDFR